MGIFDFLKRNKEIEQNKSAEKPKYSRILNEKEQKILLETEIETFFPETGYWGSNCFDKSNELLHENLPCHLRDNAWMSSLLHKNLLYNKAIYIPQQAIEKFLDNSERFNDLRHNYELEIVKWQIDWMRNGGEGWSIPEGHDELSIMFSPDVIEIFRGGVVKTLTSIGMDEEVVEEGIEKNADMFREKCLQKGFKNEFEPVMYRHAPIAPADESHKQDWLKAKRYEYYCNHKQSVDKYGEPHPDMLITPEEVKRLYAVLSTQNAERKKTIERWQNATIDGDCDKTNKSTACREETLGL